MTVKKCQRHEDLQWHAEDSKHNLITNHYKLYRLVSKPYKGPQGEILQHSLAGLRVWGPGKGRKRGRGEGKGEGM